MSPANVRVEAAAYASFI
jgi:hypothetical protein